MRYNPAANSFYIIKLSSRLFVLYCRSRPKDDRSRQFDPHFEEVMGGVEPWWMARWKALAEFLLSVIELPFLSLTAEALQGKTCQDWLLSATIVHNELHTHLNRPNSSLDWVLSHWAHFTVLRFICVYVLLCV